MRDFRVELHENAVDTFGNVDESSVGTLIRPESIINNLQMLRFTLHYIIFILLHYISL